MRFKLQPPKRRQSPLPSYSLISLNNTRPQAQTNTSEISESNTTPHSTTPIGHGPSICLPPKFKQLSTSRTTSLPLLYDFFQGKSWVDPLLNVVGAGKEIDLQHGVGGLEARPGLRDGLGVVAVGEERRIARARSARTRVDVKRTNHGLGHVPVVRSIVLRAAMKIKFTARARHDFENYYTCSGVALAASSSTNMPPQPPAFNSNMKILSIRYLS